MNSDIKHIKGISRVMTLFVMICMTMSGCTNDYIESPREDSLIEDQMELTGSLTLPEMPEFSTRGDFGDTPGSDLKLTIFEFDLGSDAAHSFLSHIYNAEITSATTAVGNNGTVNFKFTINKTDAPKVLHLMLADKPLTSSFGSVASIFLDLSVSDNKEAYWGAVEFADGYNEKDESGKETLSSKLTGVPMIRNFAKISVSENLDNFELLGFEVINVPLAGTVAPLDLTTLQTPSLLDGNKMKKYSEINYSGVIPGNATFGNTEAEARKWNDSKAWTSASRYVYEHPYESTRRSYLIIYGTYTAPNNTSTTGYYKIDIGNPTGDHGMFEYYDIIRNIAYNVTITKVEAPGMATVSEAIDRAPFNNISASTETSSMLNISDNHNMLVVNDTNHIIIEDNQKVEVLYRYVTNITGNRKEENLKPYSVNLVPGPVIKEVADSVAWKDNYGVNWMKIIITCNKPDDRVKTQSFSIVDGNGLGRTINLVLRNPWKYSRLKNPNGSESDYYATIAPVTANLYTTPIPQNISNKPGEPLTVFFDLPDGLPETMFPLEFQLEPEYQGIENDKIGNLVVHTGPSLVNPEAVAISYIKTLSYKEYLYQYTEDDSNDVDINKPNKNHTVRCRFLTINTVDSGSPGEITIHCEYFKPNIKVKFERVDLTAPPDSNSPS